MKKIIFATALICSALIAFGIANDYITLRKRTPQNTVVAASSNDTLVGAGSRNVDTGYAWAFVRDPKKTMTMDVLVTQLTGSITTTSHIVYGCYDTGSALLTADWEPITGLTTYCAACIGASSTTVPGTSKHYKTVMPANTHNYNFIMARAIHTGTFTATYSGNLSIDK